MMWVWHKTASKENESLWQERLASFPGAVLSEGFAAERIAMDVYSEAQEELLVLMALYGGRVEAVATTDWVAATAPENVPPLLIRNKLVISASESPEVLHELRLQYPNRHILCFPAERAFGTGNHATTSSCLRLLCDFAEERRRRKEAWNLIDIGCGTGVLALAGMRFGATSALSFDFDPAAVEVARRNMERNGGAEGITLFQADVFEWAPAPGEAADLVLANLFSTVLQKAFPRILPAMKPGGILIISGILHSQAEETLAAAEAAGLRVLRVVKRGKWTTAQLTNA